jgi:hypothetical protein
VKKKILFEDATMGYNKWVSGMASREFSSQRLRFKDLVNKGMDVDQSPNDAKANNVLPYPLNSTVPILGDLLINTTNALKGFKLAQENPLVKDKIKTKEEVELIVRHLTASLKEIEELFRVISSSGQSTDKLQSDSDVGEDEAGELKG